jgi:Domain of unknown function (DUF4185)
VEIEMTCRFLPVLALQFVLAGATGAGAAETNAPAPLARIGSSEKICQLTGDTDWQTGQPTAARTFSNFGLRAVDLGYPVEHAGKLILLFGDSLPAHHPNGVGGEIPPDDAVGVTLRKEPPGRDGKCLELQIHQKPGPAKMFAPATVTGPIPVKQGFFNVPSGGVSVAGALYAFFFTNHCTLPTLLKPAPDDPLIRPPASPTCSENDDRSSVGRGVMARSNDDGRTFNGVVPMPAGFVYSIAVNSRLQADLPEEQRLGVFIFGVARYRAGVPYLAQAPLETLADPATWRFFAGRTADGQPKWVKQPEWQPEQSGDAASRNARNSLRWKPPADAEILGATTDAEHCIGEFSVTWNHPLRMWLMLYNCDAGRIEARIAPAPWGPWSTPTKLLGKDEDVDCRLVMTPAGCGNREDFWASKQKNDKFVAGSFYAPFVLNRYTTVAGSNGSTIYWLVSTWNPYEVMVMRSTIERNQR